MSRAAISALNSICERMEKWQDRHRSAMSDRARDSIRRAKDALMDALREIDR